MKSSQQEIIINHSAKKLYNIVLDIEKYPDFLPWCSEIIIKSKSSEEILADMKVNYNYLLNQTFTSHVFFNSKKLVINTKYIKGPLKNLKTKWIFKELKQNKTKVLFNVTFEFQKYLHQKFAEFFFELIEHKMIDSFKKRADDILY